AAEGAAGRVVSVVVEARDLLALVEPHMRTTGDQNSPVMEAAKKLASYSDTLTEESAYRYLSRLRGGDSGTPDMHFVQATRADETVLALLGDSAALQLRSLPHFFDSIPSATEAAEAALADDDSATRVDVK